MTGAPVPRGADGVIPVERASVERGHLVVSATVPRGRHIRRRGEEVRSGAVVARSGSAVHPGVVSTLASVGCATASVYGVPRVAVIATGNETVVPGNTLRNGEIYDSNTPMLTALVRQAGIEPVRVRRVRDHRGALRSAVEASLGKCDVLVTTGGVSMGERDHLRPVLEGLGVREVFWRVRQKPGKPLYFGTREGKLVFGLPGNPASALVCFYVYVYPALRWLGGHADATLSEAVARVEGQIGGDDKRFQFLRGRSSEDGSVEALPGQGSHMVTALGQCDRLIVVPPGPAPRSGRRLNTLLLPHAIEDDR
jgi:molybdopterin molybdotransferase